ncbi:hypothetical protein OVY01_21555 [Robbsia sp. Bb-Pol-6]|uniref:Transposase n=1 Tax=Robbsia betulipollinis TaxID=2981849 RepID=A0ABT3ZV64_9BURK|nr:hypothetical protein [Robbsia betulipollinis]MCY0389733.1 hypothetical protein [Robbsia betulipollinis]
MTMEDRMQNWGGVVRSPRFKASTCAVWAQWFIALRDQGTRASTAPFVHDEADAWAIERAWREIPNPVTKALLKAWYVQNMNFGQLRTYMWREHHARLRAHTLEFALANARRDMENSLSNQKKLSKVKNKACELYEPVI